MDLIEFAEFVIYVREKEQEEKIFAQWLAMLPALNKYVDFDDFKTMVSGSRFDMRSDDEIIKEIEEAQQKAGFEWKYSS